MVGRGLRCTTLLAGEARALGAGDGLAWLPRHAACLNEPDRSIVIYFIQNTFSRPLG